MNNNKFSNSLSKLSRLQTVNVKIGNISLGKDYPVRTQSMTNTKTSDTIQTVKQCIEIANAGADYVRITVPTIPEAENLKNIKSGLLKNNCNIPLIADIHFSPKAAEIAAKYIEKVRINPGNYIDKKISRNEYSEQEYNAELQKLEQKFTNLINICKQNNTALRIGVNHGSLSARIMLRYGDTPQGMVESAMEFLRICKKQNFNDVVISMKSSNVRVMIQAYRLLVNKMFTENMMFPLHLGVTEAGDGIDGRVKSAIGIGTLLNDGIGDTIRVSLTEPPQDEIPVAKAIVNYFEKKLTDKTKVDLPQKINFNFFEYNKNKTADIFGVGGKNKPVVIADLSDIKNLSYNDIPSTPNFADFIFTDKIIPENLFQNIKFICNYTVFNNQKNTFPYFTYNKILQSSKKSNKLNFAEITNENINQEFYKNIDKFKDCIFVLSSQKINSYLDKRAVFLKFFDKKIKNPVIVKQEYNENNLQDFIVKSAFDNGGLFIDGFGDGIFISNKNKTISKNDINKISFSILQAARVRISKTDYISCPSCGRTLFDLQTTTEKIKQVTSHLTGLKIGIMGCIVNGIGEMADADYGYVGEGKGKISLYKNKELIKR
ncbi:MAG: 4-hydroxy-3-methylbut-2-en-1-yl diphosphate synthase, partial [Bacteroidetes bacterium]